MCIVNNSTVGIESMLYGKPTIAIDSSIDGISSIYLSSGDIKRIFQLSINDVIKKQEELLEKVVLLDGSSLNRIFNFVGG